MPDLGLKGRVGARRRTKRLMTAMNEMSKQNEPS
jgi:hypothetical protein